MGSYEAAALITGLFIALFMALKGNCGRVRMKTRTNIGDGGHDEMVRAIRAQGNAIEDVPIILLGFWGLALLEVPGTLILGLGGFFLIARILHAVGIGGMTGMGWGRLAGTIMTLLTFITTAGALIFHALA